MSATTAATQTFVTTSLGTHVDSREVNIGTASKATSITIGNGNNIPVTINGNLQVNGGTTTVSSTNTVYSDTLLGLQNGLTGFPVKDSGFIINRGTQSNAFIGFDESEKKFRMALTASGANFFENDLAFTSTGTLVANLEGTLADSSGNELVVFGKTDSAVNEIKITNAAAGSGPTIAANGGDPNVDLNISAKGSGKVNVNKVLNSSVATIEGAPFTVASTARVANLNAATAGTAETVTGATQSAITSVSSGALGLTVAGSGPLKARTLESTVATIEGAPFTVASTARVANLNAATAGTAETVTGATQSAITSVSSGTNGLTVVGTGLSTVNGALTVKGDIKCADKFTVANDSGNTAIAGTLSVSGAVIVNGGSIDTTDKSEPMRLFDSAQNLYVGGKSSNIFIGTDTNVISGDITTVKIGAEGDSVEILGNLTVSGTTTTVNSTNLEVEDRLITLNKGGAGETLAGAGFTINSKTQAGVLVPDAAYIKVHSDSTKFAVKLPGSAEPGFIVTKNSENDFSARTITAELNGNAATATTAKDFAATGGIKTALDGKLGKTETADSAKDFAATGGIKTALDEKLGKTETADSAKDFAATGGIKTALDGKAPLASPVFSGTPQAPTANAGTNTAQLATCAFVQAASMSGPPGPAGAVGPAGAIGPIGPIGPAGPAGSAVTIASTDLSDATTFNAPTATTATTADRITGGTPVDGYNTAGTKGEIRFDGNYIYVCVLANKWKRATLLADNNW